MTRGHPSTFSVAGVTAVLADLTAAHHEVRIDPSSGGVSVVSEIRFDTNVAGHPVFDLVPEPDVVRLDDSPTRAWLVPFGSGPSMCRMLENEVPPGRHRLRVEHDTRGYRDGEWLTVMTDKEERGFLERYLPTGFEDDTYELTLSVRVDGPTPHAMWANDLPAARRESTNRFEAHFDPRFCCSSFFWVIGRMDAVAEAQRTIADAGGGGSVVAVQFVGSPDRVPAQVETLTAKLERELERLGPVFSSPFPYTSLLAHVSGGMEHAGAMRVTEPSALHELCHQYIGRTLRPATGQSAWFDEGIAEWIARGCAESNADFYPSEPLGGVPFQRAGSINYGKARLVIEHLHRILASDGGVGPVLRSLRAQYPGYVSYTNAMIRDAFERAATNAASRAEITELFHQRVEEVETMAKRESKWSGGARGEPPRPIHKYISGLTTGTATDAFHAAPEQVMTDQGLTDREQRVLMTVEPDVIAAFVRIEEKLADDEAQAFEDHITQLREDAEKKVTAAAGWPGPGITVESISPTSAPRDATLPSFEVSGNGLMDFAHVQLRLIGSTERISRRWIARLDGTGAYTLRKVRVQGFDLRGLPAGTYAVELTNALALPVARNEAEVFTIR